MTDRLAAIIENLNDAGARRDLSKVKDSLIRALDEIRTILREASPGVDKTRVYCFGFFLRALLDHEVLKEKTSKKNWHKDAKLVESVWTILCDAATRLDEAQFVVRGPAFERVTKFFNYLANFYVRKFGPGMYTSPDILVRKSSCTICGQSIKACSHIPGRVYDGKKCQEKLEDMELLSVSMVANPEDPRCRIWPWYVRKGESRIADVPIIMFSTFDDFLRDDNWTNRLTK